MNNNVQDIKLNFDPHDSANQLAHSSCFTNNLLKTYLDLHRNNELFVLHLNIRSAYSNFEKFRFFLENVDFPKDSIVGLTETWFTDTPSNLYSLPDHNIVVKNRLDKRGGGVALFIPSFLNFSTIQDITFINDTIESLFVEIHIPKRKKQHGSWCHI